MAVLPSSLCTVLMSLVLLTQRPSRTGAVPLSNFYTYGENAGDSRILTTNATTTLNIEESFNFYGTSYSSVTVNFNGVLMLGSSGTLSNNPESLPLSNKALIAPFWTEAQFPGSTGTVFFRVESSASFLTDLRNDIDSIFQGTSFRRSGIISKAVVVTWNQLQGGNNRTQTNTFQCVLALGFSSSYVIFQYGDGHMNWAGRQPALVGMNAGDGANFFQLPTSQTSDILRVTSTGNTGAGFNGRWLFILQGNQLVFPGALVGFTETRHSVPESQPDGSQPAAKFCVRFYAGSFPGTSTFRIYTHNINTQSDDYTTSGIRTIVFDNTSAVTHEECGQIYLVDDVKYEFDEEFNISLKSTSPSGPGVPKELIAFLPQTMTIIILDDDSVFVTYGDVTVSEETGVARLPVRLVMADGGQDLCGNSNYQTQKPVRVMYTTLDGTAKANIDYTPTNGTLTILPGSCINYITVQLHNDIVFEENEYFRYTIWSNNSNITVNSSLSSARVTIEDMDGNQVRIGFTKPQYTVTEGQKVKICVSMTAGLTSQPINVAVKTDQSFRQSHRALAGEDYGDLNATFVFQPTTPIGQKMCFNLTTRADSLYEGQEEVRFFISSDSPVNRDPSTTRVNIVDTNGVTISLANDSLVYEEGGLSDRHLKVCANLMGEIERNLTIKVTAHEGTAKFYDVRSEIGRAGDFIGTVKDIVFPASSNSIKRCSPKCVECTTVTIQDDHVMEMHNETFFLTFSNNDPAVHFINSQTNVTIIDNSNVEVIVESFSLADVLMRENEHLNAQVCVMRDGDTTLDIKISIAARDVTATNHVDFEVSKETVTIYHNNPRACGTITVTLLDDLVVEGDEVFTIFLESLTEPSRVLIDSRGEKNVTIIDDDSVSVKFLQSSYNVSESQGSVNVCLQMRGLSAIPLPVLLTPAPLSAEGVSDFEATPLLVSLPPSPQDILDEAYSLPVPSRLNESLPLSSPFCANVSIVNDDIAESEIYETFSIHLSSNTSLVDITTPSTAIVTIQDDDDVVVELVSPVSSSVMEGEKAEVCAGLLGRANFTVLAKLLPVGISARRDMDFSSREYVIEFPPMTTEQQCVLIPTLNDSVVEREEKFQVLLRLVEDNSRIILGQRRSVNISIIDDDVVEVGFDKMEYSVNEEDGSVEVCVNMTGQLDIAVTVFFSTETDASPGSGQAMQDYIAISNQSLFTTPSSNREQRRECVTVMITNDQALENTEHFNVLLSSPDPVVRFSRRESVVYILDEDGVRVSLEERRVTMSESDASNGLEVCVALQGQTEKDVVVVLATEQGSASEGSDYVSLNTTLTFLPSGLSEQRKCDTIDVKSDDVFEEDEEFIVTLRALTSAVGIHISRTVVTIMDDDQVTLSLVMSSKSVFEGEGSTYVCVNLMGATERNVSYTLQAHDIEAMKGVDYTTSFPSPLFFPVSANRSQSQCFHVNITDDDVLESTEHFEIELHSAGVSERVGVNNGRITVTVTDDDTVEVMFVKTEIEVDEDSPGHNGTVCVALQGEIDRAVSVAIASSPGTAKAEDFMAVRETLTFTPVHSRNQTICFYVYAIADRLVETREEFTLTMTTSDTGVSLTNHRAVVVITDNDVVCSSSSTDTSRGYFTWPTTYPEETAIAKCENGMATRYCSVHGVWSKPVINNCYVSSEELLRYLNKTKVDEDSLRDLLYGLLQMLLENTEPTLRHMRIVDNVLGKFADHVENGSIEVDTELFALVLEVVDILTLWPPHILKDYSSNVIHSQERITVGLFDPQNFTSYAKELNRTAFYARQTSPAELFPAGVDRILFSFGDDIQGKISVNGAKRKKESSIELPTSLISSFQDSRDAKLFLSYYSTGVLFPVEQSEDEEGTLNVTAVVAASFAGMQLRNLSEDILVTIFLGDGNYSNVSCVSWDFEAVDGQGAWVEDGCELIELDDNVALCSCNHLTNFACLVNIRDRVDKNGSFTSPQVAAALNILSVVGICLSIVGLVLTVVTLVVFNKLRKKDNTVFRVQLCVAMILLLVTFVAGIDRVESFAFCVLASCLIHYFTLTSFLWMAAEALLMFHKLVFVFSQVSTKFLAIVSAVCWLLPIPVVIIPVSLDRHYVTSDSYCFISNVGVFFGAFLAPIMAIILFNSVFFVVVVTIVLKHAFNSKRLKDSTDAAKRKTICRTIFSSLGIMSLLGLTWVFGAFTISGASTVFQFLFVIFNTLQGFFIFLFFVVMAKETQDLWLQACGCKKRKKRVTLSSAIISSSSRSQKVRRVTLDENAERLKEMEVIDIERRKKSNTWDIAYVVPQNQFDIFLSSDAVGQKKKIQETKDGFKNPSGKNRDLQAQEEPLTSRDLEVAPLDLVGHQEQRTASPAEASMDSSQENALECLSTADSGILMDNKVKRITPSPTLPDPPPCQHMHTVSGGYMSAGSSLETLPQREEDCYVKDKKESIDITPHLKTRAIPNEYSRLHIEKV